MAQLPEQQQFGRDKYNSLPMQCKTCEVQKYCRGECPKNRFLTTADNEHGLNYLCAGYKRFFRHAKPYMQFMANEIAHPPANVMSRYKI
ncbi:SPASM domain-containing protein [Chitinophaga sancti]|uniref:SPASM domain-containing protein n=1 Tax=Chitinophaga sancti TaxID=1004 RepID=A0A1K1SGF4_9BACT|nr:SPASM domain-containing protein [Chitinophaga sancti]WQD59887.1 SPASM domain-containing protein [Chitinophaga sancti]WQG87982.1 SPASM domain-containing protein [Chitinophaga sancti]SFW83456.1 radical SAM additional 4Fe4S-binding SPASM domain-containing protein [Chitinophaga sancti]